LDGVLRLFFQQFHLRASQQSIRVAIHSRGRATRG